MDFWYVWRTTSARYGWVVSERSKGVPTRLQSRDVKASLQHAGGCCYHLRKKYFGYLDLPFDELDSLPKEYFLIDPWNASLEQWNKLMTRMTRWTILRSAFCERSTTKALKQLIRRIEDGMGRGFERLGSLTVYFWASLVLSNGYIKCLYRYHYFLETYLGNLFYLLGSHTFNNKRLNLPVTGGHLLLTGEICPAQTGNNDFDNTKVSGTGFFSSQLAKRPLIRSLRLGHNGARNTRRRGSVE